MRVYSSGPITGLTPKQAGEWRSYVREKLELHDIEVRDPLRGSKDLHNPRAKIKPSAEEYSDAPELSDTALTYRDRLDVLTSDIIFVNLLGAKEKSIGTICEISIGWDHRKMVVAVMEERGNVHDHPMIRAMLSARFSDLDQAIQYVVDSAA